MLTPPRKVYPGSSESIQLLFDSEDEETCELCYRLRSAFPDRSDVEPISERYHVLSLFPGGALELQR